MDTITLRESADREAVAPGLSPPRGTSTVTDSTEKEPAEETGEVMTFGREKKPVDTCHDPNGGGQGCFKSSRSHQYRGAV